MRDAAAMVEAPTGPSVDRARGPAEQAKRVLAIGLPLRHWRLPVARIQGRTTDGERATALVAAPDPCSSYIVRRLLGDDVERVDLGRVPLWELPRRMTEWGRHCDLTIAHVDRGSERLIGAADRLSVPEWVGMRATLPENLDRPRTESLRHDLRRVERAGFAPEITYGDTDYDAFYERFHVPFVHARHGAEAFVRPLRYYRRAVREGGIVWARLGGERVAGEIFTRRGDTLRLVAMGLLRGDLGLVETRALAAVQVFGARLARALGCTVLDFRGCRPSLTDGALRYKAKWDAALYDKGDVFHSMLLGWERFTPALASFLERTPLLFRTGTGFSALTALRTAASTQDLARLRKRLRVAGLHTLWVAHTFDASPLAPAGVRVLALRADAASSGDVARAVARAPRD